MTDEPVYVYVKGQGWIPEPPCESFTGTTKEGYRVTLLRRDPTIGERGWWIDKDTSLNEAFDYFRYAYAPRGSYGWPVESKYSINENYRVTNDLLTVITEGRL
jgi:phage terminase large subunit GpA-like protein